MSINISTGEKDNPKVYIPPPLIYVGVFFIGKYIQKKIPIDFRFSSKEIAYLFGAAFVLVALFFLIRSLWQFFITKNTLITVKPASSLQTGGIYNVTRNPMYVGLANVYLAITCFAGEWWNVILFPLLILIVQEYIIKREEKYLARKFGQRYLVYKSNVRRWF